MTIGAAQMMLRCVFDGSISMQSMEIERRPYHKNCSCELHKLKHGCPCAFPQQRMIIFTKKGHGVIVPSPQRLQNLLPSQRVQSMGNKIKTGLTHTITYEELLAGELEATRYTTEASPSSFSFLLKVYVFMCQYSSRTLKLQ